MRKLLRGKPVAEAIAAAARKRADTLREEGVVPALAVVRVGDNPGDLAYERTILKHAEAAGVEVRTVSLDADASQDVLSVVICQINEDPSVHGCLLMRPLPAHIDEAAVCELLDPRKDIDGITRASLASVFAGSGDGFAPSTAEACIRMLDFYNVPLDGRRAAVVGRSLVVGKPLSMLLLARNATVTMCHSHTGNLDAITRGADVVVCAVGKARAFDQRFFSADQTVLDVGINFDESGAMCGDVHADSVESVVAALSPVPGGIGSVTTAVTLDHVVTAAERASLN